MLMFSVGAVSQVNTSWFAVVGSLHHTPAATQLSASVLVAGEIRTLCPLVFTPCTVTVWLLPAHPEAERVTVRSAGGFAAPTSSAVREMLLDRGFPLTVLLVGTAPTSLAVGVQLDGLAPTSDAVKEMSALNALLFTVLEVGTAPTSAALGVQVLGRAPTSEAV